jgi:glycine cleavage system H protein
MEGFLETTVDKFVFRVATDRFYTSDGVWAYCPDPARPGRVQVGLTDYVQQRGGDVAFVHFQPAGTQLAAGAEFADMDTIKSTQSLLSPVGGILAEVNATLGPTPEVINQDPYGRGWLALIDADDWEADRAKLLDAEAYLDLMRKQALEESA